MQIKNRPENANIATLVGKFPEYAKLLIGDNPIPKRTIDKILELPYDSYQKAVLEAWMQLYNKDLDRFNDMVQDLYLALIDLLIKYVDKQMEECSKTTTPQCLTHIPIGFVKAKMYNYYSNKDNDFSFEHLCKAMFHGLLAENLEFEPNDFASASSVKTFYHSMIEYYTTFNLSSYTITIE